LIHNPVRRQVRDHERQRLAFLDDLRLVGGGAIRLVVLDPRVTQHRVGVALAELHEVADGRVRQRGRRPGRVLVEPEEVTLHVRTLERADELSPGIRRRGLLAGAEQDERKQGDRSDVFGVHKCLRRRKALEDRISLQPKDRAGGVAPISTQQNLIALSENKCVAIRIPNTAEAGPS